MRHWRMIVALLAQAAVGAEPQARCRNFLVNPSTGPAGEVDVTAAEAWSGRVALAPPEGWVIEPASFDVALAAGASKRLSFRVVKARENASNVYAFCVSAGGAVGTQLVRVASAPYGRPEVDGRLGDEWRDAIPLAFETGGRRTVMRAFWNEETLCVAVEVDEAALVPSGKPIADGRYDAVQLWVGARGATGERHEFLIEPQSKSRAVCRRLAAPRQTAGAAEAVPGARVAVRRSGEVTAYEVSVPLEALEGVRADAGRECALSLLVHDPDGAGLRDLGASMNRPAAERCAPPARWTLWAGGCWAGAAPYDGGSEFGFCSSIH